MFHHWNGGVLGLDEQPQTSFWFSEGFTEFYTRRLMLRAGLLDEQAWLDDVNDSLRQYVACPALRWSAARIRDAFFTDRAAGAHAYRRGDAIAMAVDDELSRRAGRAGGLDDWMRDLVARARGGEEISPERWFELLAERTDAEFAAHVRAVAVDGAPLRMPEDFGFPDYRLEPIAVHGYELGFDFAASVSGPGIVGVAEDSAAYRAGLRNGMRLAGFAGGDADPDAPVRVTVLDAAGQRLDLEWLPRGDARPGWRLVPRAE
jgi:predicted metalloprotease with PDZ domain